MCRYCACVRVTVPRISGLGVGQLRNAAAHRTSISRRVMPPRAVNEKLFFPPSPPSTLAFIVFEKKSVSRIPHSEIQHREKWRRERNIFGGFQKFCKNFDRSKLKRATAVSLLVRAVGSSCEYNSRYLGEHAFPPPYVRRG